MEVNLAGAGLREKEPVDRVREYLKCKMSALYFVENYCVAPVVGGYVTMKESDLWHSTYKYRQLITAMDKLDAVSFLSSRQHGKTTTALFYMMWALLFYPKLEIQYITIDQKRANDAIKRMKDMLSQLPTWMQIPFKGKSDKVTYIELENGSKMSASYVSGSVDPDTLGRGLSSPIIWIDEVAFVRHAEIVWGSAQPVISAAREFAKKNNYPSLILFTTTPNGAGENFFYQTWMRGHDASDIFDGETIKIKENYLEILDSDPDKNNFVNVRLHWSETGKDEKWYQQQVKELNFDRRRINQELNIVFLGSSNAVFADEILEEFIPVTPISTLTLAYGEKIHLTQEIDPTRIYLLGVDSAATRNRNSDWSALALTDAITGEEVGVWHGRFSVIKRYAVVVKSLIQGLHEIHGLDEDTLIVIIERNSFGLGVVEELLYDDNDFDYAAYVFYETRKNKERIPGLTTTAVSRDMMFNLLLSNINEQPKRASSQLLQEELRNLEQKNSGKFEASVGAHDDIIMAYNFTLYVREEMIKEGTIAQDGKVNKFDIKRASYFLDVTMSSGDSIHQSEKKDFIQQDYHDEKLDRKRILKEMGLKDNYEKELEMDDVLIFGSGLINL